jgi:hypothetical protein
VSTLRRIVNAFGLDTHAEQELVHHLVRLADAALAPESAFAARVERRRARRARRKSNAVGE